MAGRIDFSDYILEIASPGSGGFASRNLSAGKSYDDGGGDAEPKYFSGCKGTKGGRSSFSAGCSSMSAGKKAMLSDIPAIDEDDPSELDSEALSAFV